MAISQWPQDQRPRERLLASGPESLSDSELIAILLRTGIAGKNAIELDARCSVISVHSTAYLLPVLRNWLSSKD